MTSIDVLDQRHRRPPRGSHRCPSQPEERRRWMSPTTGQTWPTPRTPTTATTPAPPRPTTSTTRSNGGDTADGVGHGHLRGRRPGGGGRHRRPSPRTPRATDDRRAGQRHRRGRRGRQLAHSRRRPVQRHGRRSQAAARCRSPPPDADYCNDPGAAPTDDFDYTLNGGDKGTISVTVTCVIDNPVAVDDRATVGEDERRRADLDVLANDTDADAVDDISITAVDNPSNGTASIVAGKAEVHARRGLLQHRRGDPRLHFNYTVNGGDTATVSVTVTCAATPGRTLGDRGRGLRRPPRSTWRTTTTTTVWSTSHLGLQPRERVGERGAGRPGPGGLHARRGLLQRPECRPDRRLHLHDHRRRYGDRGGHGDLRRRRLEWRSTTPARSAEGSGRHVARRAGQRHRLRTTSPSRSRRSTQPANGTVAITGGGREPDLPPRIRATATRRPAGRADSFTYTLDGGSQATVARERHLRRQGAGSSGYFVRSGQVRRARRDDRGLRSRNGLTGTPGRDVIVGSAGRRPSSRAAAATT